MNRGGGFRQQGTATTDKEQRLGANERVVRWAIFLVGVLALAWGFSQDAFIASLYQDQPATKIDPDPNASQTHRTAANELGASSTESERRALQPSGARAGELVRLPADRRSELPVTLIENYTAEDLQAFKENYACDLAREARESCDTAYAEPDAYDRCLSLRQYFSYSRHCGYQP